MNLKFYKKSYMEKYDVVVVGSGNAALCAALSARDNGILNFFRNKAKI